MDGLGLVAIATPRASRDAGALNAATNNDRFESSAWYVFWSHTAIRAVCRRLAACKSVCDVTCAMSRLGDVSLAAVRRTALAETLMPASCSSNSVRCLRLGRPEP